MKSAKVHSCRLYRSSQRHVCRVTDKIRYKIDSLGARIADSIIEGVNAIETGGTKINHAKWMIISL